MKARVPFNFAFEIVKAVQIEHVQRILSLASAQALSAFNKVLFKNKGGGPHRESPPPVESLYFPSEERSGKLVSGSGGPS